MSVNQLRYDGAPLLVHAVPTRAESHGCAILLLHQLAYRDQVRSRAAAAATSDARRISGAGLKAPGREGGATDSGHRPGFEIGQIRGERTQRVFAHGFIDQMAQRFDILIGQNAGQHVAAVHRQNGGNRIECFGAPFDGGEGRCGHRSKLPDGPESGLSAARPLSNFY